MKLYLKILLVVVNIAIQGYSSYITYKLYKFAKEQSEWNQHVGDTLYCLLQMQGRDSNDIWLAALGLHRQDLTGPEKEFLKPRPMLDSDLEECMRTGQYYGWLGEKE